MRKIYGKDTPDVTQDVADRATALIERACAAAGVSRAGELPEEQRVALLCRLNRYFRDRSERGRLYVFQPTLSDRFWGWLARLFGGVEVERG